MRLDPIKGQPGLYRGYVVNIKDFTKKVLQFAYSLDAKPIKLNEGVDVIVSEIYCFTCHDKNTATVRLMLNEQNVYEAPLRSLRRAEEGDIEKRLRRLEDLALHTTKKEPYCVASAKDTLFLEFDGGLDEGDILYIETVQRLVVFSNENEETGRLVKENL